MPKKSVKMNGKKRVKLEDMSSDSSSGDESDALMNLNTPSPPKEEKCLLKIHCFYN